MFPIGTFRGHHAPNRSSESTSSQALEQTNNQMPLKVEKERTKLVHFFRLERFSIIGRARQGSSANNRNRQGSVRRHGSGHELNGLTNSLPVDTPVSSTIDGAFDYTPRLVQTRDVDQRVGQGTSEHTASPGWYGAEEYHRGFQTSDEALRPSPDAFLNTPEITITQVQENLDTNAAFPQARLDRFPRVKSTARRRSVRAFTSKPRKRLFKIYSANFLRVSSSISRSASAKDLAELESNAKDSPPQDLNEPSSFLSIAFSGKKGKENVKSESEDEMPSFRVKRLSPHKEVADCGAKLKIRKGTGLILTGMRSLDSLIPSKRSSALIISAEDVNPFRTSTRLSRRFSDATGQSLVRDIEAEATTEAAAPSLLRERINADLRMRGRHSRLPSTQSLGPTILDLPVSFSSEELGRGQVNLISTWPNTPSVSIAEPPATDSLAIKNSAAEESEEGSEPCEIEAIIDLYDYPDNERRDFKEMAVEKTSGTEKDVHADVGNTKINLERAMSHNTFSTADRNSTPGLTSATSVTASTASRVHSTDVEEGRVPLSENRAYLSLSSEPAVSSEQHSLPSIQNLDEDYDGSLPKDDDAHTTSGDVDRETIEETHADDHGDEAAREQSTFGSVDTDFQHSTVIAATLLTHAHNHDFTQDERNLLSRFSFVLVDAIVIVRSGYDALVAADRALEDARIAHEANSARLREMTARVQEIVRDRIREVTSTDI